MMSSVFPFFSTGLSCVEIPLKIARQTSFDDSHGDWCADVYLVLVIFLDRPT